MPHTIEFNQAIDILSSVDETYRRAEQLKQIEESGIEWSGLDTIVTLTRLELAYLMLTNSSSGQQQKTVLFSQTGFPALSSLLSDAQLALSEHSDGPADTRQVVHEILADFGKFDQAALVGKANDRANTLRKVSKFMSIMNGIHEQHLLYAQRNIQVAQRSYSKKEMHINHARFWESQGTLVAQFYQAKTKDKPEWFSRPQGYKFFPSEGPKWKSFFLSFIRKDDLERATSWWNNTENLTLRTMIPHAITKTDKTQKNQTEQYPDWNPARDKGVLALLAQENEPWITCIKVLNFSAMFGYTATVFSILQEADTLIRGLADVAKDVERQTDRQGLEKLSHDLAQLSGRISELPDEAHTPIKNAIKTAVEHTVTL